MNFSEMSLSELKAYAKEHQIPIGNLGKEKLIEKIKNHIKNSTDSDTVTDIAKPVSRKTSIVESISEAVNGLGGCDDDSYADINLDPDELIRVKSITFGGLTYRSQRSNVVFRWNQIGDVRNMTVDEIIEMNNHKPSFLNSPLVLLLDERAISYFRLRDVYEKIAKVGNLSVLFTKDTDIIENVIDHALEAGMRDVLISKVKQMVTTGTLTNIKTIKLLEKKLKYDLADSI